MSALEWLAMEMVISVLKYKSGRRLFFFQDVKSSHLQAFVASQSGRLVISDVARYLPVTLGLAVDVVLPPAHDRQVSGHHRVGALADELEHGLRLVPLQPTRKRKRKRC